MKSEDVEVLSDFAANQGEAEGLFAKRKKRLFEALEAFGRQRLSEHFYMRDFLYSEISAVYGIPNIPSDPETAVKAGKGLCETLLEPLHRTFGGVVVRSAYRSRMVNAYGHALGFNCGSNRRNRAKHIWDWPLEDGCIGATACIVIPWFIRTEQYRETEDWRPLAWYIHDHLEQYSEMVFFATNAAFNLTWRERDPLRTLRKISCKAPPHKGTLTERAADNHSGDHSSWYPGFLEFKG